MALGLKRGDGRSLFSFLDLTHATISSPGMGLQHRARCISMSSTPVLVKYQISTGVCASALHLTKLCEGYPTLCAAGMVIRGTVPSASTTSSRGAGLS